MLLLLAAIISAASPAAPPSSPRALVVFLSSCSANSSPALTERGFNKYVNESDLMVPNVTLKFANEEDVCKSDLPTWKADLDQVLLLMGVWRRSCVALQNRSDELEQRKVVLAPACARPQARAAVVLRLAKDLGWQSVLLLSIPATDHKPNDDLEGFGDENEWSMCSEVAQKLSAAGINAWHSGPAAPVLRTAPHALVVCSPSLQKLHTLPKVPFILLLSEATLNKAPTNFVRHRQIFALTTAGEMAQYEELMRSLRWMASNRSITDPITAVRFVLHQQTAPDKWIKVTELEAIASEEENIWRVEPQSRYWHEWTVKVVSIKDSAGRSIFLPAASVCFALLLLLAAVCGMARAIARRLKERRNDVLLSVEDISFPAGGEARRVGDGMESMLSCWLQQLHEFGGPDPRAPPAPSPTHSDQHTRLKGDIVRAYFLPVASNIELKRKGTEVLRLLQALRHENLSPFLGCVCEIRPALVYEHCSRGTLEDVLRADDIRLDWAFRLSLLTDLVRGMRFLHTSDLRYHGRLSSRACGVDARWVLRLGDYGIPAFNRSQGIVEPPRAAKDMLWTAPELLRDQSANARGSQPGDVFAFGIVMQEVILRGEPYCMLQLSPEELVEKLTHPPPLIRPSVSMSAAPPEAVSAMRQCWSEQPDLRPDFQYLNDVFRNLNRGRKVNIVDSMFEMLEKYSNNLEELVKERTEQLVVEKKKTEQLLNRMLPPPVAERLLSGGRVEPEEFSEVTVYFSDIVGFTELAARSTPVQVVALLNALYTRFDAAIEQYSVYKVETIGDAYMVVGGLRGDSSHAEHVASMALHLLHEAGNFQVPHLSLPLLLRAGAHSGACCAGVVGRTMPRYCLFGDTVNTAARMESTGAAWRVQLSASTAALLARAGGYRMRARGLTPIKGKGVMYTYWLLGKEGFDRTLPDPPPLTPEEAQYEPDPSTASNHPLASMAIDPPSAPAPKLQRQWSLETSAENPRAVLAKQRSAGETSPQRYRMRRRF